MDYVDAENFLHAVDSINTTECETAFVHSQDIVAMLPTPYTDNISMFYAAMNLLRWSPAKYGHEKAYGHPIWRNRHRGKLVYCINPHYIEPTARSRRNVVLVCACPDRSLGAHINNCSSGDWSPDVRFPSRFYFATPEPAVAPVPETLALFLLALETFLGQLCWRRLTTRDFKVPPCNCQWSAPAMAT